MQEKNEKTSSIGARTVMVLWKSTRAPLRRRSPSTCRSGRPAMSRIKSAAPAAAASERPASDRDERG